jgi:ComF family protein
VSSVSSLSSLLRSALTGALDLLLPRRCAGCGGAVASARVLCASCHAFLAATRDPDLGAAPPALDACRSGCAYAGDALRWLQAFKYPASGIAGADPTPGAVLCSLVREAAQDVPGPPPGAVIPVPLHPRRLRARGFNPAAVLARALSECSGAPMDTRALRRLRDTPSQTGLDRRGRRRNVARAFLCCGRVPRVVWLVDDVVTTGATLSECARMLRRNGARRVVGLCAARTPLPREPE